MRSVTAEEMRRMDQMATKQYEIPETLLVENAARSILQCIDLSTRHTFAIFCGPGNNGADGLALARHLLGRGKKVMVYLIDKSDHPSEAWRINRTCIGHMTDAIRAIETLGDLDDMLQELKQYNTVIDAMFGTGLNRELKGVAPIVIDNINQSRIYTISVDMPSGLDATTGRPFGAFIEANEVITMECMKKGLESNSYVDCPVHVVSAGLPQAIVERVLGVESSGESWR